MSKQNNKKEEKEPPPPKGTINRQRCRDSSFAHSGTHKNTKLKVIVKSKYL